MVNLEAHRQQITKTRDYICNRGLLIHANGRQFNTLTQRLNFKPLFKLKRCHHCQKEKTQQSIKQFSKQLLMLAKLRAYAFTSSKTFVSMNNTVCDPNTHI